MLWLTRFWLITALLLISSAAQAQTWSSTHINSTFTGGGTTTVTAGGSTASAAYGSVAFVSGSYYWEMTLNFAATGNIGVGLGNANSSIAAGYGLGNTADSLDIGPDAGGAFLWWNNAIVYTVSSLIIASGDRMGFALLLDRSNGHYRFWWRDITQAPTKWYGASNAGTDNPGTYTTGFDLGQAGSTVLNAGVTPAWAGYRTTESGIIYYHYNQWIGTAPTGYGQMPQQAIITATGTWSLPSDWPTNNTASSVECLGSGGSGSARISTTVGGVGGGGGEYAQETNVVISGSKSVTLGTGGGTTNTTFPADSVAITAHFGATGTITVAGAGGTGSTNTGHFDGGAGFKPASGAAGGGGGGAAGPLGAGASATSASGGSADNAFVAGGTGIGANGTEWNTAGSGAGGAGAAAAGVGFAGGKYGGGGGGHYDSATGNGAAGAAGVCIVSYTPGGKPPAVLALDGAATLGSSSGASASITLTTTQSNDGIFIASVSSGLASNAISSISSSHLPSSGWQLRSQQSRLDGGPTGDIELWYTTAAATLSSETITVNYATSMGFISLVGWGVSFVNTSPMFDCNSGLPALQPANATAISLNTTNANDFIFSGFGALTPTPAAGSGWTAIAAVPNGYTIAQYQIVTAVQSGLSATTAAGDQNEGLGDAVMLVGSSCVAAAAAPSLTLLGVGN